MKRSEKARVIRAELERISKQNGGRLTAALVVRAAKNPANPLHKLGGFRWDMKRAAMADWLNTARGLITTYITVMVTDKTTTIRSVGYLHDVRQPQQQGYIATTSDEIDRSLAERLLDVEFDRVCAAITRARGIAMQLAAKHPGIDQRLEQLLQQAVGIRELLQAA
jgi:hypothetical protein